VLDLLLPAPSAPPRSAERMQAVAMAPPRSPAARGPQPGASTRPRSPRPGSPVENLSPAQGVGAVLQAPPARESAVQAELAAPTPAVHGEPLAPGPAPRGEAGATPSRAAPADAVASAAKEAAASGPSRELLESYGRQISQALGRYKEYPPIAQLRGWQGSVMMRLRVAPSGRVIDAQLYASSGHEVLDRQALAMAGRTEQLPVPPDGLRGGEIDVLVPIAFRLQP